MSTIAPTPPQMLVSNVIQLVNEGDTRFDMEYSPKQRLQLNPGERIFVNEEVAWYFLGRWWTNNDNPRNRIRQDEYQRLRTLYGCYEDDRQWEKAQAHNIAAYTPDGNRIVSVVDDPDGVQGTTASQLGREMSLESQVAVLQDTLLQMQAQIAAQSVRSANEAQPEVPTETAPRAAGIPTPGVATTTIPGTSVTVPIAPPAITPPDEEEPLVGVRLEPNVTVVQLDDDPSEATVEEDAPAAIPHGPTGGRIPAS